MLFVKKFMYYIHQERNISHKYVLVPIGLMLVHKHS